MITDKKVAYTAISVSEKYETFDQSRIIALPGTSAPIRWALLIGLSIMLLFTQVSANETTQTDLLLPTLQNTPEDDRLMLREIGDRFVFETSRQLEENASNLNSVTRKNHPPEAPTVWEFVRQSRRLDIPEHQRITDYRQQYQAEAPWIGRILHRATPFAGHIVEELDKRYLPVELALLPVIESGYRPDVHSSQNAAGIWQIVPSTAEDIGISRNAWFDGRSDIRQSTSAAIDYLSYLNAEFHGDWMLTLAAYNAGLGRVRSAIKQNTKAGLATDFWSLKLPRETRNYVPKFLALVALLRHDKAADFELSNVPRGSAFDLVDARRRVSLDRLADMTGLPEKHLRRLNAGLVHGITPPDGPHLLYVPQGYGKPLIDQLINQSTQALYTPPETHRVVAGDTLSLLAMRYKTSLQRLMELNSLDSPMIRIGQSLTVLDVKSDDSTVEYVVTIGDTLYDIAQQFLIDVADIRDEHGRQLIGDVIHPGEKLTLLTRSNTLPTE